MAEKVYGTRPRTAEAAIAFAPALPREEAAWAEAFTVPDGRRPVETVVVTHVNRPHRATLRFLDPDHRAVAELGAGLGAGVRVTALRDAEPAPVPLFTGEVVGLGSVADVESRTGACTVVRAADRGYWLALRPRVTAFRGQRLAQVVEAVARRAGLRAAVTVAGGVTEEVCVDQTLVTDWDYLQELALTYDAQIRVDGWALTFGPLPGAVAAPSTDTGEAQSPYVLRYGSNLLDVQAFLADEGDVSVQVRSCEADRPLTPPAVAADTTPHADPGRAPRAGAGGGPAAAGGSATDPLVVPGIQFTAYDQVARATRGLAVEVADTRLTVEAQATGSPRLSAGRPVALENLGVPFTGRYTIAEAEHVIDGHGYRTRLSINRTHPSVPSVPGTPYPLSGTAPVPGPARAEVTAVEPPDETRCGRVKVRFPWLDDTYEVWADVVQWNRGSLVLPAEKDLVLVQFEHGRLDRPLVTGFLDSTGGGPPSWARPAEGTPRRQGVGDQNGTAYLGFTDDGELTLSSDKKITLKAPTVEIN
ncbi:phage baseplate assembly protein V [Kitasatospora sp. NPDC058048]|uniref:phage baseplate assembly protein V n=1 Tax=Kitasatospora sp. NPDC058048 TaxID=3346313 RepID=UPI0036DA1D85